MIYLREKTKKMFIDYTNIANHTLHKHIHFVQYAWQLIYTKSLNTHHF